jgi:hypothetical protein
VQLQRLMILTKNVLAMRVYFSVLQISESPLSSHF